DDQQIRDVELEVPQQLADRLAALVHERHRLGEQQVARSHACHECICGGRLEGCRPAPRRFVDDRQADVVPRPAVPRSGISETDDQLHFFLSSPSSASSFLPFLMTSGSAAAAGAAAVAAAPSAAGAATSSAFGMITWTIIMSASLTGFHFGFTGRSRTPTPWCSINSPTVSPTLSRMSARRHSTSLLQRTYP